MKLSSSIQIKLGAILSYAGIVVYILVGLLYTPWMIKVIGKDDYGLYTLAYSVIAFFLFDFGISVAIQRFISKYLSEKKSDEVNHCVSLVCKLYLLIDVFVLLAFVLIYFMMPYMYRELLPDQIDKLKIIFLMVGCYSVLTFPFLTLNGILSAYEKFVQLKLCDLFSKIATVSANVICLLCGGGLYAIVATNIIVGFVVVIVKFVIVRRETTLKIIYRYYDKSELFNLLSFSGWTSVVALCQRCIFNIAPSILAVFAKSDVIAVFGIAISLEGYTFTFAYALNGMFMPKISRILNSGDSILPLMIRVGRIQIIAMGIIIIGFILVGHDFIFAWLGEGFEQAYLCTLLLILPAFMLLPADIADQTLIASGNIKYRAYVYIIMAVVNIMLSFLLTAFYGIVGLAFSIFISYMVRNVALYYMYKKILNVDIWAFAKQTFVKMFPGLIISFIISALLITLINTSGWLYVGEKLIIVFVIYIATMWLCVLNGEEKSLFISILRKLCRVKL